MQPDRSNYEIWLIDWLDGNLDKIQTEHLMSFLEKNPDIKEEAENLSAASLFSEKHTFFQKENLKKSASDLSHSQLDYLSVAYLENDLTVDQLEEFKQILNQDLEGKKSFEIIRKLKLTPFVSGYKNKSRLKKLTVRQKIFRSSVAGLSAAAVIALLITSIVFIPRFLSEKSDFITGIIRDSLNIQVSTPVISPSENLAENLIYEKPDAEPVRTKTNIQVPDETIDLIAVPVSPDSSVINSIKSEFITYRIPSPSQVELPLINRNYSLVASNTVFSNPVADADRGILKKFIARVFREKLLKEESLNDAPLKPYEIAKAGIDGINKLLGWEMALRENNDETGELTSVSFNSRILKFNAPVKKIESSQ